MVSKHKSISRENKYSFKIANKVCTFTRNNLLGNPKSYIEVPLGESNFQPGKKGISEHKLPITQRINGLIKWQMNTDELNSWNKFHNTFNKVRYLTKCQVSVRACYLCFDKVVQYWWTNQNLYNIDQPFKLLPTEASLNDN